VGLGTRRGPGKYQSVIPIVHRVVHVDAIHETIYNTNKGGRAINEHIGIGRLTKDPELRYSTQGLAICEFSIAINEKRKDKEEVEFIDYVAFDKRAETIAEYARKGRLVCVSSAYHTEKWVDKQSQENRYRVRMRVNNVEFLDSPKDTQDRPQTAINRRPEPDEDLEGLPF
jgi:single-strand DNA-binding protein